MPMLQQVNEESTAYLRATFLDKNGVQATPASLTYSIYCLTNGIEIRASAGLTPAGQVEIMLDTEDNRIVDELHDYETRRVTIEAVYGERDAQRSQYDYVVRNLSRVT